MISQHYHLRRGVHSRSLRAPQVDPSPVFAKPPLSSVLIQSVPPFFNPTFRLCRVFKSSSGPDIFCQKEIFSLYVGFSSFGCQGVSFWSNLDTPWILFNLSRGSEVQTGEPLCGRRKSRLRSWCDRSELIEAFGEVFQ